MLTLANPARFLKWSAWAWPALGVTALILLLIGLPSALIYSPADYQQGDAARIMYVHVPAAWNSLAAYAALAGASFIALIWRTTLAQIAARVLAPIGAAFTALALVTGMLWGKPMWGAYWVWGDARLMSVLVVLFLFLGVIALRNAYDDETRGERAAQILALLGIVNLPIVKFSVEWWHTLHQGESIFLKSGPKIPASMLWPLGIMGLAYMCALAALTFLRMRTFIFERRAQAADTRRASRVELQEAQPNA